VIVKVGKRFVLRSKSTGKVLGNHPTRAAAKRQEAAIKAAVRRLTDSRRPK
jgi:hypothetical protein